MNLSTAIKWFGASILATCSVGVLEGGPARAQSPPPYRVASIRASLYLNQKDSLSANVIDNPSVGELFNTTMGGGWAHSPSEELVVTVEVSGDHGSYATGRAVA